METQNVLFEERNEFSVHSVPISFLDFITLTILGEEYRSLSSSLCRVLHSLITSSFLGPIILLNTPFSNTLSVRSSICKTEIVKNIHYTAQ
jgi:hypothetical protein